VEGLYEASAQETCGVNLVEPCENGPTTTFIHSTKTLNTKSSEVWLHVTRGYL